METLKRPLASWPATILFAALTGITVGHALFTVGLFNPQREPITAAVTDTSLVKKLTPPPADKFKPVQPVAVTIAVVPDTLKRKQAEARPITTRVRATPLRKNRELVEMDYIDPHGIESRVATVVQRGTWELRGDTIAPVLQDRSSVRRERWRRFTRTARHVGIGVGIGAATVIGILVTN